MRIGCAIIKTEAQLIFFAWPTFLCS